MTKTYETRGPIAARLALPSGSIDVETDDAGETVLEIEPQNGAAEEMLDDLRVTMDGSELVVEVPSRRGPFRSGPEFDLHLRCPAGSTMKVQTASADVSLQGRYGDVEVRTASGDIQVERVEGSAALASASGDVEIGEGRGPVEVNTTSGDVEIGQACAGLKASLVSGDLRVLGADGGAEVRTTSGDLSLEAVGAGSVHASTVSGDVSAMVRPGLDVWMDVLSTSGETVSELEPCDGAPASRERLVELRIRSVSGDVTIGRSS
jgi:hypothetical protein